MFLNLMNLFNEKKPKYKSLKFKIIQLLRRIKFKNCQNLSASNLEGFKFGMHKI